MQIDCSTSALRPQAKGLSIYHQLTLQSVGKDWVTPVSLEPKFPNIVQKILGFLKKIFDMWFILSINVAMFWTFMVGNKKNSIFA